MKSDKEYTPYQKGLIRRYYQHRETIHLEKLQELISALYLAESEAKKGRLWKKVHRYLVNLGVAKSAADSVMRAGDLEELSRMVAEIF